MNQQLDLFGSSLTAQRPKYSLFLAILPDSSAIQQIEGLTVGLSTRHNLTGKLLESHYLHITLHYFGQHVEIPSDLIGNIEQACETAAKQISPFEVTFNQTVSFSSSKEKAPFVLLGNDQNHTALNNCYDTLLKHLIKHRCSVERNAKFKPHVTLLYDRQRLAEQPTESISWRANEIVLVCSEVGLTKHRHLKRWQFRG